MATSPGSGWASGPLSSGKHRGGNGVWRFPITLSERGAHRGVVATARSSAGSRQWVHEVFGARRCTGEHPTSADHKRTSMSEAHEAMNLGRAGRRGRARGCRDRATGWRERVTGCSSSRRSASPARRRAATASRRGPSASSRTWASGPQLSGSLRFDGLRSIAHGVTLELEWPEHPDFPDYGYVVRRRDLDKMVADARRRRGRRGVDRRRGRRPAGGGRPASSARWCERDGVRGSRCGPATWWWPTAPTRASGGRWAARATARTRWAWRCGATSPARSTTSRGSRATSTCATATATTSPATAGSSRWATAP